MTKVVRAKRSCCQSRPRCKRCPVVLKRLDRAGLATKRGRKYKLAAKLRKRDVRAARAR